MVADNLILNIKAVDKATKVVKDVNKTLDETNKKLKVGRGAAVGLGMAFLFGGMAMNRFFGVALRGIWNTYKEIIDVNDVFFQATQRLNAAWEFFKFSLIDALSQSPLFLYLIELVITLVNWFGQLSPEAKETFVIFMVGGWAATKALSLLGQAILFIGAIVFIFGASAAITFLLIAAGVMFLLGIIIIFRKRIWAMLQFLWHGFVWIGTKFNLVWINALLWVADKIVAFVNWAISQFNRIPGIDIKWRAERPTFLTIAKTAMEEEAAYQGEAARAALGRAEEALGPEDIVKGIQDLYGELKKLNENMKDMVKDGVNEADAVVIPSVLQ